MIAIKYNDREFKNVLIDTTRQINRRRHSTIHDSAANEKNLDE
jgi:hypothetical protein